MGVGVPRFLFYLGPDLLSIFREFLRLPGKITGKFSGVCWFFVFFLSFFFSTYLLMTGNVVSCWRCWLMAMGTLGSIINLQNNLLCVQFTANVARKSFLFIYLKSQENRPSLKVVECSFPEFLKEDIGSELLPTFRWATEEGRANGLVGCWPFFHPVS